MRKANITFMLNLPLHVATSGSARGLLTSVVSLLQRQTKADAYLTRRWKDLGSPTTAKFAALPPQEADALLDQAETPAAHVLTDCLGAATVNQGREELYEFEQ